jgi:hypothetical protein
MSMKRRKKSMKRRKGNIDLRSGLERAFLLSNLNMQKVCLFLIFIEKNAKDCNFKVADINFTFKNRKLLSLLEQRGQFLLDDQQEKANLVEGKIRKLVEDKYEELIHPITAFITFETEDGYLTATALNKLRIGCKNIYKTFWQGFPVYFKPCKEPDAILWQDYEVRNREK